MANMKVDQKDRRSDNDALYGGWCKIVSGTYSGRAGAYVDALAYSANYPSTILVQTRDAKNELITVNYSDARPATRQDISR
jgi:hypothetical protein